MSYPYSQQSGGHAPAGPNTNGMAMGGLVLGIISWILFLISIILNILTAVAAGFLAICTFGLGAICGILALPLLCLSPLLWLIGGILSGVGYSQISQNPADYSPASHSLAVTGLALNGVGFLISLCGAIIMVVLPLLGMAPIMALPFLEGLDPSSFQ